MLGLSVNSFYESNKKNLQLELLNLDANTTKILTTSDTNRPGLALAGYLEHFTYNRIQVLGNVEINFLKDSCKTTDITEKISKILKIFNIPCFVITNSLQPPKEILDVFIAQKIPLFTTSLKTENFIKEATAYLEDELAPRISMHGTLLEMYGLGVVLVGKSGIGKSECALELIKKGHQLVSDDLVNIKRLAGGVLVGFANNLLKHHMEIRGMGIISVKQLFGVSAILDKTNIDMIVELKEWSNTEAYDRLGELNLVETILSVDIPKLIVPVKPGRNLAVLMELAAMKFNLKKQGYNTVAELNADLISHMQEKGK